MTQNQDNDGIPTRAAARRERREHIAELQKGDKGDRRLAKALLQCRKGNRCNLEECAVCERRKQLPRWKAPARLVKSINGTFGAKSIYSDKIEVEGKRRPLNEKKVREIAASMKLIGLQMPIGVRTQGKKLILVDGWHRLAAAKRLGWDTILCFEFRGDKVDARIWQIVENLCRAELKVLERAEYIEELRTLVQTKTETEEGQVAPPGGRQPKEFGIKKTAKALGLTKEEVRRSKAMAGMSPKAKAKVRKLGLDDNQRALLKIAKQSTPKAQLHAIAEIVERKRAARDRNASAAAADQKTSTEITALEAKIREKESTLENVKGGLAADRKQLREIQDKLAVAGTVALRSPPNDAQHRKQSNAAAHSQSGSKVCSSDLVHDAAIEEVAGPSMLPVGDDGIPPFLDRRPLSVEDQLAFDAIKAAWVSHVQPLWNSASAVVRERIDAEVIWAHASSQSATE